MTGQRNDGNTTVGGGVSGTGIAIGAGASASVAMGSATPAPELAAAIEGLRAQLEALDVPDDDDAERVALARTRLERLETAAAAAEPERDPGRIRRLLGGIVEAVGGVATLAGSVAALQAAVTALLH